MGPHPVPSTAQQPKEVRCELWGRKKLQNTVRLPRQSQRGKKVSLRRKSLCILAAPASSSTKGGWDGQDGQDALLDKQPPCCWLYPECFPALEADVPQGRRHSAPGILMPSCSRGLLGLHWLLAQPSSHNPCPQSHTPPCLPALPSLALYSLFACSLPFPCYVIRLY